MPPSVLWTGKTQYGGSSALSFFSPVGNLVVPPADASNNTITLVVAIASQTAGGGFASLRSFVIRDNNGNDVPFDHPQNNGNHVFFVPQWPAALGGYVRLTWDVGFSAVGGVIVGALFAEELPFEVPIQVNSSNGGGAPLGVVAQVPPYDMILAAGIGASGFGMAGLPNQTSPDWVNVVAHSDDHSTIFNNQLFGVMRSRAAISLYTGPIASGPTTPTWDSFGTGSCHADTTTTPIFRVSRSFPLLSLLTKGAISSWGRVIGPV